MKTLNIIVNNNCNARCTFCNIWKNKQLEFISPSKIAEFLSKDINRYVREISITGGEPTLHPKFTDIIKTVINIQSVETVYLTTNGSSLKKVSQAIDAFANTGKKFNILVSIDGAPEKNDRLRGKGAYLKAIKILDYVHEMSPLTGIGISTTLSAETEVKDFNFILDLVAEKDVYFTFRIAESSVYYKNSDTDPFAFSISDKLKALVIDYLKGNHKNAYFYALLNYLEHNENILIKDGVLNCCAGEKFATIKSSGEIVPCIHASKPLGFIDDIQPKYTRQIMNKCPCFTECTIWPNINYGAG
ncbi:radical SAM protein [Cedecea neteri]|uniref:radical SAM protein n=1 Tax=Cedecea neteri TaxID=158822 RepID=UPI00057E3AEE|nr:radical SAM protein [Cedecea neteri]